MNLNARAVEFIIVVLGAIGAFYLHLNSIHADRVDTRKAELKLEQQILSNELNRDNFARRAYEAAIGMKKKLTSAKTANDPDSRINKSLRAWNC